MFFLMAIGISKVPGTFKILILNFTLDNFFLASENVKMRKNVQFFQVYLNMSDLNLIQDYLIDPCVNLP